MGQAAEEKIRRNKMADSSVLKVRAESKGKGFSFKNVLIFLREWIFRNKFYFLAFAIPVILLYTAYAIFGLYPFGEKSVLVLDLNGQYVYYFEALRDAFWGDGSIFYNWSRNLSGGYMGIIGYYLASPYTLIVMLLPETMILGSLLIMQLAKIGSAAVAFSYYLQKSKKMTPLHSTLFSTLYALMAYCVIQLMDPMWLDGLILLPLIMLGVEYLVDDGRKLNYIIPLAIMFVVHFYIGYMIGIFTALYYLYYQFFGTEVKDRRKLYERFLNSLGRMAYCTVIALCCAAFMLLPMYNALKLGKFDFSEPDFSFKLQFKPLNFFGQMFVAQYDTVDVDGSPEIYCGVLTVLLLPLFYLNKEIATRKKIGYTLLAAVLFISMYIRPIDMVWHGFQAPNWLPFRYSFTFSFVMLSMAATTFSKPKGIKLPAIGGSFALIFVLLLIIDSQDIKHLGTMGTIWLSVGLCAVYALIVLLAVKKEKLMKTIVPIMLLVISSAELVYNAQATFKDEDKDITFSTRKSWYNFIETGRDVTQNLYAYDEGFYRADKTFHRTVNDTSAFGLRGISHSSSVMNAKFLKFVESMGYSASTYYSRYDGGSPLPDSILGIKYVLDKQLKDDPDAKPKVNDTYTPVFSYEYVDENKKDRVITAYQNPNALSIGFMADENSRYIERYGTDNTFNSQNILLSTLSGNTELDTTQGKLVSFVEYYKRMDVDPNSFILNNVTVSPYGDQTMYTATQDQTDHTVDMLITPQSDQPIYIYFKTDNQKSVNLWLSTTQDSSGNFSDFDFVSAYFENHDYHSVCLGRFEPGKTFDLRMTVANEYAIVRDFFFYQFDEELYQQSIDVLKAQQWNLTRTDATHLEGTITAKDHQIMVTSIPYEPGWNVKVDGEKVDPINISEAFIGIPMGAGEHTVEMRYVAPGLVPGVLLLIVGVACIVFLFRYDKKNNKMLIKIYKEKAAAKNK